MYLNINIQAHPKRKEFIPYLLKILGKNTPVIWDEGRGVWDTRRRCLEQHIESGARWCLTIQDDCLLPDDFVEKATAFLKDHKCLRHFEYAVNFWFGVQSETLVRTRMRRGYYKSKGIKGGSSYLSAATSDQAVTEALGGKGRTFAAR